MSDIKYLETHEWYLMKDDEITVGISDFAQNELGDIVYVTLQMHMHRWIVQLQL